MTVRRATVILLLLLASAACSRTEATGGTDAPTPTPTPTPTPAPTATDAPTATPAAPTTAPPTTAPPTTAPTTTSTLAAPVTTPSATGTSPTAEPPLVTSPPTTGPAVVRYVVPVADVAVAGWADEHHDYPATDVFVRCGAEIVSPVDGVMLEVRRISSYEPGIDNPATRGGRSLSILGDDRVRYYLAHLDEIVEPLEPGDRVAVGQPLGTMGQTGRASACHLHLAISPLCPGPEWSVRRGVVWPYPYLDDWRAGGQRSPAAEVAQWSADHPTACADAMADPNAADA